MSAYTSIYACMRTCMRTLHAYMHANMQAHMRANMHSCTYTHACVCSFCANNVNNEIVLRAFD